MNDLAVAVLIVRSLLRPMCRALAHAPVAQVPFRYQYQDGIGILRLLDFGEAALSLVLFEDGKRPPQQTISFTDSECTEIVLAGRGTVQMLQISKEDASHAVIERQAHCVSKGAVLKVSGPAEGRLIENIGGQIIALRLTRSPKNPSLSREFRLDYGALVHRASGRRQEGKQAMARALIGAMERTDAISTVGKIAGERDHPLRWEAIRKGLTLDTNRGFRKLDEVASNPNDPLSETGIALKTQLIAAYPQLAQLEEKRCRA